MRGGADDEPDSFGTLFWHRALDVCHFSRIGALPVVVRGCASVTKDGWLRLFKLRRSRLKDPSRYFERFKVQAREFGLERRASARVPDTDDAGVPLFHLDIERCYEAAFAVLGSPHPGGPEAERAAAERRTRCELLGRLAWLLSQEARRRRRPQ